MSVSYWKQVVDDDFEVPSDRPLGDLTEELTRMLGSTDPTTRDETAYPALATWTDRGVYDDLLAGLGDGMAAGLTVGLGEKETDSVFRRSFSVLILGECVARDNVAGLVPGAKILEWGDRIATWYLRERDLRGFVPGKGWAHTVAHGADAIGALAESPHFPTNELTVLLDVLADRLQPALGLRAHPRGAGPDGRGDDEHPAPQRRAAARDRAVGRPDREHRRRRVRRGPRPVPGDAATPRPSCARSTSSSRWRPARPRCAPTCCWCSSTRCGRPTRTTSRHGPDPVRYLSVTFRP